jgi:hypothetical protein
MSKKHYIALAAEIAKETNEAKREFAAQVIVIVAKKDNAAFDAPRFRKACNLHQV